MDERITNVNAELQATADKARSTFGGLSVAQLNWKPAAKSWSVAQCFDHLITTHALYFPLFERLANGESKPTFWERASPLSGYFGRFLIRSLDPKNLKKMKTTAKAEPSASEIDGDIIERYCQHQTDLIDHLRSLPEVIDAKRTIITSPLMGLITYSLDDCFTVFVVHGQRHFDQARRVMDAEGFPA